MPYYEVPITPAPGGFGAWQTGQPEGEPWQSDQDLLETTQDTLRTAVYCLGVDALPDGLEDISGRISDEPEYVYGWLDTEGLPHYFGITHIIS